MNNEEIRLIKKTDNQILYWQYAEFLKFMGLFIVNDNKSARKLPGEVVKSIPVVTVNNDSNFELDMKRLFPDGDDIVKIYNKYNLTRAASILRLFAYGSGAVYKAGEYFYKAAGELDKISESSGDWRLKYATLYCKQKANYSSYLCDIYLYYNIEKLLKEAESLINTVKNIGYNPACVYLLKGMIAKISKEFKMKSIEEMVKARKYAEGKLFKSEILFEVGVNCDNIEELNYMKNDAYELAYNLNPIYQHTYKFAFQFFKGEEYSFAIKFFKECLDQIGCNINKTCSDPLAQEFYFKTCSHLANIYNIKGEYLTAINYAEKAIDLRNKIYCEKDDSEGYDKIYYDLSKDICIVECLIDIELKRMNINPLYRNLANSYLGLGLKNESNEYFRLLKNL